MANPNGPVPSKRIVEETMEGTAERSLSLVATFTATSFDLFHVGDDYRESFEDEAELRAGLAELAEDVRSEFVERGLFAGMRPVYEHVEYRTESTGERKSLQIFCGGVGMLLLVEPDEPVEPLVQQAARLLGNQV
ncbi:MAG: hypothetical protein ABEJ28_07555 [Salinigranum sp.]